MKADFSTWKHNPDNPALLKAYAELAIMEGLTGDIIPKVVWRDGELTLTLNPEEGEQTYEYIFEDRRVKEEIIQEEAQEDSLETEE
jgi:hypothetical protein